MNSPGQKLVDSFETEELSAVHPRLPERCQNSCAHSIYKNSEMGYLAHGQKPIFHRQRKNDFYDQFGEIFSPNGCRLQESLSQNLNPEEVLGLAKEAMLAS